MTPVSWIRRINNINAINRDDDIKKEDFSFYFGNKRECEYKMG